MREFLTVLNIYILIGGIHFIAIAKIVKKYPELDEDEIVDEIKNNICLIYIAMMLILILWPAIYLISIKYIINAILDRSK